MLQDTLATHSSDRDVMLATMKSTVHAVFRFKGMTDFYYPSCVFVLTKQRFPSWNLCSTTCLQIKKSDTYTNYLRTAQLQATAITVTKGEVKAAMAEACAAAR